MAPCHEFSPVRPAVSELVSPTPLLTLAESSVRRETPLRQIMLASLDCGGVEPCASNYVASTPSSAARRPISVKEIPRLWLSCPTPHRPARVDKPKHDPYQSGARFGGHLQFHQHLIPGGNRNCSAKLSSSLIWSCWSGSELEIAICGVARERWRRARRSSWSSSAGTTATRTLPGASTSCGPPISSGWKVWFRYLLGSFICEKFKLNFFWFSCKRERPKVSNVWRAHTLLCWEICAVLLWLREEWCRIGILSFMFTEVCSLPASNDVVLRSRDGLPGSCWCDTVLRGTDGGCCQRPYVECLWKSSYP